MQITVYSTPTCPFCQQVRTYLEERNVEFVENNVADNEDKRREMEEKSGQIGVPVVDIGGTIVVGFNPRLLDEAIAVFE